MRGIPFSLEINGFNRRIFFTARTAPKYLELLESQLYNIWPDVEIQTVTDFLPSHNTHAAIAELDMPMGDIFPLKSPEEVGAFPLANVYSALNKLRTQENVCIQISVLPISNETLSFRMKRNLQLRMTSLKQSFHFWKKMVDPQYKAASLRQSYTRAHEKNTKTLYQCALKVLAYAENEDLARDRLQEFTKNYININNGFAKIRFKISPLTTIGREEYAHLKGQNTFLTSSEISTLFHIPREEDKVPNIFKVLSRKAQPPLDLPILGSVSEQEMSTFGHTNFRDLKQTFGITYQDRERHMYVVGKSGSGKSKLLELLIRSDILNGKGVGVIDPHGDLIDNVMNYIPEHRVKDVILFDPADTEFPITFNPLEQVEPQYRIQVAAGFVEIFKKLFGSNWTPRLEHVLRFVVLALLDTEKATPMSILKLLTDRNFRQEVIPQIQDSVVKQFWTNEFASWSERFDSEAITPILNKIGQFLSHAQIRNIVCQQKNAFTIKQCMDEGKIILVKLSKGILGEENSELLGSMFITKVQQAAMQRANVAEENRRPFYFYVDEFQNFATDTFGNILSEARKYKLSLTVSHQYMGQLTEKIRSTIFGNIGSIISFRVGADDAAILAKEFAPVFTEHDLVNLGVQEVYLKMTIHGEMKDAFSARTMTVPARPAKTYLSEIVEQSRKRFCRPKIQVENELAGKEDATMAFIRELQQAEFEAPFI